MIPLLILRPQPGAAATAKRAEMLGLMPVIRSLFMVEPRAWEPPDATRFDAIVLTSANAVRIGSADIARYFALPVYAVGTATAQAARTAGFADVREGAGDATAAFQALVEAGHSRPLHLAGADRTDYPTLPFEVTTRVVYAAVPADVALPPGRHVALVHSARAAARYAEICPSRAAIDVVAISAAVAEAASVAVAEGAGWRSMTSAPEPTDNAMLALATMLCDGKSVPNGQD